LDEEKDTSRALALPPEQQSADRALNPTGEKRTTLSKSHVEKNQKSLGDGYDTVAETFEKSFPKRTSGSAGLREGGVPLLTFWSRTGGRR